MAFPFLTFIALGVLPLAALAFTPPQWHGLTIEMILFILGLICASVSALWHLSDQVSTFISVGMSNALGASYLVCAGTLRLWPIALRGRRARHTRDH